MILLIFFAFLAGIVTILSPCILPILPIVLSGSLSGGKKRPLGIVAGFIGSFTFFTLFLSSIVRATGIPPDLVRNIAIVLIFTFGIFLIIPQAQLIFEKLISKMSSLQNSNPGNIDTGFWGGLVIGASLGLVWAPCVGPILASIITLSITAQVTFNAFLIALAYATGTAIPMLIITYSGRRIFEKIPWLLEHTMQIQQSFGVLMVFTALALFAKLDIKFQTYILEKFPNYGAGLTQFEEKSSIQEQLEKLTNTGSFSSPNDGENILSKPGQKAPGFQNEQSWINSKPLTLEKDLKGKVVLVDFWTYTCINCVRTFPYLRDWYDKYHDLGLEIVGVHSPEFEFEKVYENVVMASKEHRLNYPIVQDNDFVIWRAYKNNYWPAHYLIDKNGDIRYFHFGEGKYLETENAIRLLLDEKPLDMAEVAIGSKRQTPEIYLGYQRAANYTPENPIQLDKIVDYQPVGELTNDAVAVEGKWQVGPESITAKTDGAKLRLNFLATNVYLVITPPEGKTSEQIEVKIDGQTSNKIPISQQNKYDIVSLDEKDYGRHTLEIIFPEGASAFAFTFGS